MKYDCGDSFPFDFEPNEYGTIDFQLNIFTVAVQFYRNRFNDMIHRYALAQGFSFFFIEIYKKNMRCIFIEIYQMVHRYTLAQHFCCYEAVL